MTTTTTRRTCAAVKRDGSPCGSWAVTGSAFCIVHDPARAATMAEARRRGGRARHGRRIGGMGDVAHETVALTGPGDVLRVIEAEVNMLLSLERSISRARAVGALLSVFVQTWESSELERRIAALETQARGG